MRFRHNLKCFHGNIKCMAVVGGGWGKGSCKSFTRYIIHIMCFHGDLFRRDGLIFCVCINQTLSQRFL